MKKRLIPLLLAICMVLSLAQTAFAATPEDGVIDTEEELVAALATGGEIVLGDNITVTNGLTVPAGITVTLDLTGYTVSMVDSSSTTSALIKNNGVLTIRDSSEAQTGRLSFSTTTPDTATTPSYASNTITNAGVLTVSGGTIENTSASGGACYAIDTAWHTTDISIEINGGTIKSTANKAIRVVPYSATAKCTLNITGGTVSGNSAAVQVFNTSSDAKLVDVNISGGTLSGTYAFYTSYAGAAAHSGTDIDIAGAVFNGAVYIYNGKAGSSATNFANVSIKSGIFNGETYVYTKNENSEAVAIPAISGGTFSEDVSDYLVEGAKLDENGTVVVDAVATVNGVGFASIQAAIDNASSGEEVTLVADVETKSLKINKTIVLDLNGYTLSGTDNVTGSYGLINIDPGADLTINDSSEEKTGKIALNATNNRGWNAYSSVISNQRGKLTVNGGTIEHLGGTDMAYGIDNLTNGKGTYAETVINGGTIKSTYRAVRQFLNGTEAQNILTVNGGTIEGTNKSIWMQDPSKNANTGTLTVGADATLNGDVYLFVTAGSTEWPVTVSIAEAALNGESTVITGNVPVDYEVKTAGGYWGVENVNAEDPSVAVIKGVYYSSLQDAIDAAESGDVVTLLADVTLEETIHIKGGEKITIDLNGKTVDYNPETWVYGAAKSGTALLTVDFGGDLTIEDNSEEQTGTLDASYSEGFGLYVYDVYSAVMMTAKGDDPANGTAKLTVNGGNLLGFFAGIAGNKDRDDTEITINGGLVKAGVGAGYCTTGIEHPMNGKLTITGGTVEGMDGISLRSGELAISGGTIKGTAPESAFEPDGYWDNDFAACTGHALQIVNRANNNPANETPSVTIIGGHFVSENGDAVGSYASTNGTTPDTKITGFIAGGTYSDSSAEEYLADGYVLLTSTDDAGNTIYGVDDEVEVTFVADESVVETVKVKIGEDVTLPAVPAKEGYTGTWDHDGKDIVEDTTINAVYTIKKYTVTYKNGDTVVGTVTVEHGADATAPAVPTKEGYTGAWDKDGKDIVEDTTINAVYTIKKYTVTYKNGDTIVGTVTIEHGADATAPEVPAKEGYTGAWDNDGKNITADTTINAVYTETSSGVPGTPDDSDPKPDDSKVDNNPQTGDDSNLWLWISLLVVSASGMIGLAFYNHKRKRCSGKHMG